MSILSGYMVPHPPLAVAEVGRGEEKAVQATLDSFDEVARDIAAKAPETIIITSPHTVMYSDYFHICPGDGAVGDFADFRAPGISFQLEYDTGLRDLLCRKCEEKGFPAGRSGVRSPRLDHGVMVPLYFVNKYYKNYKLLRLGLSGLPLTEHYALGKLIAETVKETGRKAVFIGSGDLSHCQKEDGPYGYRPEGPSYDEHIMDVMGRGAFGELFSFNETELEKAEECGHRSFVIMAGAFDKKSLSVRTLSHEATFGVGYGFCIYTVTGDDASRNFLDRYLKEEEDKLLLERK